jgi:two-component system chemotaxis response regulator CheB
VSSDGAGTRRVLVVDDSALIRKVVSEVVGALAGFTVVGTARDGREALAKIRALDPDIVTLDVEMPVLDGIATLETIMRESPRAVVMLSSAETRGEVDLTLRALELGAVDFVRKQALAGTHQVLGVADRLHDALRAAAVVNLRSVSAPPAAAVRRRRTTPGSGSARAAVAIACSTGGPRALAEVVPAFTHELDAAVLIAQHMPRGFTRGLAERLDRLSELEVVEARDGETVLPNRAYLAPGGLHMTVARNAGGACIALDDSPPVWGVKPAADPLFRSVASLFGAASVGIVLTGMGCDGGAGLRAIRRAGGGAVVQDRDSSTVFGMPQAALELAGADSVVPLESIVGAAATLLASRRGGHA